MTKQLYLAYGSNLNVEQMQRRCPGAVRVSKLMLPNARLVFRGVADVEYAPGEKCPGGLWWITPKDEEALDRYEGVASGLYSKHYLRIAVRGKEHRCLVYCMNDTGIMPPTEWYLDVIAQGYRDFGLPLRLLDRAVQQSWEDKEKTPLLRRRYNKQGRPQLAHAL